MIQPGGIAPRDLGLLHLRHPLQDAIHNGARPGKGGLGMRVVRPPQQGLDANEVAQPDADRILLKAENSVIKFFQVDITGMVRMTSSARYFNAGVGSRRPN